MAGSLFDSKVINYEIRDKFKMTLDLYAQEVQTVNDIFEKNYEEFKRLGLRVRLTVKLSTMVD